MKNTIRHYGTAALLGLAVSLTPLALGQEAVTQTTTTSADGTVTEFSPNTVVVHSETSSAPITYTYSKSTTIVDENGNPVDVSVVKSGVPIQVFYDHDGDNMVARRIVVHRVVDDTATAPVIKKETTTTTTTHSN